MTTKMRSKNELKVEKQLFRKCDKKSQIKQILVKIREYLNRNTKKRLKISYLKT